MVAFRSTVPSMERPLVGGEDEMRSRIGCLKRRLLGALGGLVLACPCPPPAVAAAPGVRPVAEAGWPTGKIEPALASELSRPAAGPSRLVYVLQEPAPLRGRS